MKIWNQWNGTNLEQMFTVLLIYFWECIVMLKWVINNTTNFASIFVILDKHMQCMRTISNTLKYIYAQTYMCVYVCVIHIYIPVCWVFRIVSKQVQCIVYFLQFYAHSFYFIKKLISSSYFKDVIVFQKSWGITSNLPKWTFKIISFKEL